MYGSTFRSNDKYPDLFSLDRIIRFGKCNGLTVRDAILESPKYIHYLVDLEVIELNTDAKKFLTEEFFKLKI